MTASSELSGREAQLPDKVEISPEVYHEEMDGQCVLMDLTTEHYYSLNPVGTQIWRLLVEGCEVAALPQRLEAIYEVPPETLRNDLATFFNRLTSAGLIRTSAAES